MPSKLYSFVLLFATFAFILMKPLALIANTIVGQVIDENGQVVTKGAVQIMGSNKRSPIDANGRFLFENIKAGSVKLHVSSLEHIHSSEKVTVIDNQTTHIDIRVMQSSIEVFDVSASAFHASNIESAAPVSILAGEKLKQQQASTLGETLKNQVGVHSSFYGGVTSSPIIRGLDGPRVLITQNGLDAADASRVGPDHLVATESSTVERIEVLRGPATLFYGSGAIGGVVNLVDTRIPDDNLTEGELSLSRNSNNSQEAFTGLFKSGRDNIAVQVHGFYRDSQDYTIPGYAESESAHAENEESDDDDHSDHVDGSYGRVQNTGARTQGITLGSSYLFEAGHVGFSLEHLSSLYGVPGHGHREDELEFEDEIVKADLHQNRYQLAGKLQLSTRLINAINFGIAYTDYQHTEIENQIPGTLFSSELFETRLEILHQTTAGWRGGLSLHTKLSDFAAVGEEAFTPPSNTQSFGLGIIEEKHIDDWLIQLGGRIERVQINVPAVFTPELNFVGVEHTDHEDDEHNDEFNRPVDLNFTPLSVSAGAVWDLASGYNLAFSFVHAQRAPSSAELFAFGPHIGTQTYEIGALYEIHGTQSNPTIDFNTSTPKMEKSNNIDISWRKFGGDLGAVVNVFYNQVNDYYYAANTGLKAEFEHAAETPEESEGDEHEEEFLPIFTYNAANASLYGAELQFTYQVVSDFTLTAQADYIRAKVKHSTSENLPRIPPVKLLLGADYQTQNLTISAQITHMFKQSDIAEFETQTKAYSLFDVNASYFKTLQNIDTEWYLRGRNLSNEDARVHTSFLKDLAPLPGRSVELGVRLRF